MSNSTEVEVRRHTADRPWTYAMLDRRQREIQNAILQQQTSGTILLSEVAPVITLGHRASQSLRVPISEVRARGVDLYAADRGGNATYHGRGQWVLFVVERLDRLVGDPRGVKETFRRLEALTLKVVREWSPVAETRTGAWSGVWSAPGQRGKKLASFGIKIDRGILLHGICVNGFRTPESFFGVDPCGLPADPGFLMDTEHASEFARIGERLVQETFRQFPRVPAPRS